MRILIVVFFLLFVYKLQAQDVEFVKSLTGNNAGGLVETNDGGYVTCGYTASDFDHFFIRKTDSLGNLIWTKKDPDDLESGLFSIRNTQDGGFIATGYKETVANENREWDVEVVKFNNKGDIAWRKTYGQPIWREKGVEIDVTSDNCYIIVGWGLNLTLPQQYNEQGYIFKIDSSGTLIWRKELGINRPTGIVLNKNGNYVIAGVTHSDPNNKIDSQMFLSELDVDGNEIWVTYYGDSLQDGFNDLQITTDGGYVLVGFTGYNANYSWWTKGCIIKTDSIGQIEWRKVFSPGLDCIKQTPDNGYVVGGGVDSDGYFLMKINNSGDFLWSKVYKPGGLNQVYGFQEIIVTSNNKYLAFGFASKTTVLYKITDNSIANHITDFKFDENLICVYPNPSNEIFTFELSNMCQGHKKEFALYTINGSLVSQCTLNSPDKFIYQCKNLAVGVYNYHFRCNHNHVISGKIIVK